MSVALACLLTACVNSREGSPVADEGSVSSATSVPATAETSTTGSAHQPDTAQPGVVPTTARPAPTGSTCEMPIAHPVEVVATVPDVAAPKITVALPEGWSTSAGEGDIGARFTGPDGMWAIVTIAETTLPPAVAFENYAEDATEATELSALSVLPAELCGYSGQKLLGSRADTAQQAVEFGDRLAHIPTATADYLVAVHVEAPTGTADFDPLASPLLGDFGIVIP
ncbi:hypothetical protein DQP55_03745 [Mycolicibacterium sp. GF69]|nr:hypothetical protein DQP55_03745 [Mycolicibacterium sp. GF69]